MAEQNYYLITLKNIPRSLEEIVSLRLFELGAEGVQEDLLFMQQDRHYNPEVISSDQLTLVAYFSQPPSQESLTLLMSQYSLTDVSLTDHPQQDWLAQWKAQWQPFCLTSGFWVAPTWYQGQWQPAEGEQVLWIDPGMAFGTGTHETTQIAAHLIVQLFQRTSQRSLLDVGTGSGILALLAHRLAGHPIYAYDNDPESLRVFQENCEKNQVKDLKWEPDWPNQLVGQVHITVANIIDGVLLDLKPQFQELGSQYYIFTGILNEREEPFLLEMGEHWDLQLRQRMEKGDWVGYLFEAPQ
jgi:ribosomal protein L11 methyltransferase